MPRTKKRILDNLETGMSIAPALQKTIAECLSKVPQDFYWILAQTPMQQAKWRKEKRFFSCVGKVVDAYFSGDAPPDFSDLTKYEQDEIELEVWRYLSFYSMLAANWHHIWKAIKNESCPAIAILPERKGEAIAQFYIPQCHFSMLDSPGKVLTKAMEYSAIRQMDFYFGKLRDRDETNYAKRKLMIDVQRSRRSNASSLLIKRIESTLAARYASDPCSYLEAICFFASHEANQKGRARDTVKAYLKAGYAREAFEKKEMHPQAKKRKNARN